MSHDGVWQTTADEIADYYIAHYYDQAIAHAAQLNSQELRGDARCQQNVVSAWITRTMTGHLCPRVACLRWPQEARVALCVVVNLEHMEWTPPADSFQTRPGRWCGATASPDYALLSHREYGHRVGIFRVLDVLEKHGITPTVAMDALTAEHYPYLVRHCLQRGCEIIGHGIGGDA